MSSWLARDAYSPLWVLAAGLMTYWGALGVGRLSLLGAGVKLPAPWAPVTAVLLGLQMMSLAVQILGMTSLASHLALDAVLVTVWAAGAIELMRAVRLRASAGLLPRGESLIVWCMLGLIGISLAVNLAVAVAPSTKFDEIYYHMLVPSRLVHDGALHFYLWPWGGAALPQMGFQLAAAPLHAVLLPDAPNVVSWALSATLSWFVYRVIRNAGHSRAWAAGWCAALTVGLYGTVWHVTGGAHAMGDLAVAALVAAVVIPESLRPLASDKAYAVTIGILASASVATKVSAIPLAAVLLVAGCAQLCRKRTASDATLLCAIAALPAVVLWAPSVVWTWYASGAPFGPFYSWWFPHSVYAGTAIRDEVMPKLAPMTLTEFALRQSPLLWIGALCAVSIAAVSARRRAFGGALLLGQGMLVVALLGDTRYLTGLPYGLAMVVALAPPVAALRWADAPRSRWLIFSCLLAPWMVASLYYARPFARVVAGRESANQFREEYVAFYSDYRALDLLLPRDAILLTDIAIASSYAPRLPVWSTRDIPPGSSVYQFAASCEPLDSSRTAADTVYTTPSAKAIVYRTPGRAPELAPLCVRRLLTHP